MEEFNHLYLTRENNPWGRNILESMVSEKSIIFIGQYNKFVKTATTGFLQNKFSLKERIDWLVMISKKPIELNKYRNHSIKIIKELCDLKINALKLSKFWINTYICPKVRNNIGRY